jgi:hypothetical protein
MILQFFFCVDVISTIIFYVKLKNIADNSSIQNVTFSNAWIQCNYFVSKLQSFAKNKGYPQRDIPYFYRRRALTVASKSASVTQIPMLEKLL